MKKDDILDAMSGIKEEYINEAVPGAARRKSSVWTKAGVIAACLCLFAAVGFLIPYGMNEPEPTPPVHTGDTVTHTDPAETTSPAETSGVTEDSTDPGESDTPDTEDMATTEDSTTAPQTVDDDPPETSENAIGGGKYSCNIHHTYYHSIPSGITELVGGREAMREKFANYNTDNMSCPKVSLKQIIDVCGITRDEFAETVRLVTNPVYDIDILFNSTLQEADEFYSDIEWLLSLDSLATCYMDLYSEIEAKYPDGVKEIDGGIRLLSIPELVKLLDIKREDLEEMIKKSSDNGAKTTYNYNLDMLYGLNGEIIFEKPDDVSSYELDEMFCRAGRYADNDFDFIENPDDTDVEENTPAIGGGDYPCKIHDTNYHMLPSELTAFVGGMEVIEAKFNKDTVGEMSCPMLSIKQVIDGFDISVDEFAETIRLVSYPIYDIDILFNGTLAEADEFYTNIDWVLSRGSLSTCYMDLYSEIEAKYPDGVKEIDGGIRLLSIPEVVKLLDIKREDLEEMIKKASDDGSKVTYNYNLDMLYGSDGEIIFEKPDDVSTYELDEMFCRVGRHAE